MKIFNHIADIQSHISKLKSEGKMIGFVPTMGALHEGHGALIKASVSKCDITVCSIFVNPIQFNNPTDFEKYPITAESDIQMLKELHCDILFMPTVKEMYPNGFPDLKIMVGYQDTILEGKNRPGHFSGVAVVVAKLFNIVSPNVAFFGQKDLQQCLVIKKLVSDLSFNLELEIVPTQRAATGLALSSRNKRLSNKELEKATLLYQALQFAAKYSTTKSWINIENTVNDRFRQHQIKLEYIKPIDFETGFLIDDFKSSLKPAICIAAFVGEVRLIDNIIL